MSRTTLGQIAAMADDTWINDPFDALLTITKQATSRAGKAFWQCELTDPNDPSAPPVSVSLFQDPGRYHGQVVEIGGNGNKKGSYSGRPQINVGRQCIIRVTGPSAGPQQYAPPPQAPRQAPAQHQPAGQIPPRAPVPPIPPPRPAYSADGAKIGGCVARAMEAISYLQEQVTEENIVQHAGTFLRATGRLEKGEWALPERPRPGPNGQVQTDPQQSDVPY